MIFKNYGGIYQFALQSEHDLARIEELDLARWAATSAPLKDLQIDDTLRGYLDPDGTGRMRAAQLTEARDWLFARLAKRDAVGAKKATLALDAFAKEGDGLKLRAAAERVNRDQGAADAKSIELAVVQGFKSGYAKLLANGDGVIPPGPVEAEDLKGFIAEIIPVVGSKPDRGGEAGVDAALVERFKSEGAKWIEWNGKRAEASVWGDDTQAALDLVTSFEARVDRYFLQCELLRQQAATAEGLRLKEDDLRALHGGDTAALSTHLTDAPLTSPVASGELDLDAEVNAIHAAGFASLVEKVLRRAKPELRALTRDSWAEVRGVFDGYRAWLAARPADPFDTLGEARLRELLASDLPARALELIATDSAAQAEIDLIDQLEKLLLLCRWIIDIGNNFVNVSGIYDRRVPNLVDVGSLVIDARRLEFCMKVSDVAAHKAVASASRCYLIYADIFEKEGGPKSYQIVAPVTGGERGRLRVGKRGIFVDKHGKQWDAQIKEIVENPISVREAAFAPFRRAADFIGNKIEEWIGSAADSQQASLASSTEAGVARARASAERAGAAPTAAPAGATAARAAAPPKEGLNVNSLIVGGGVALAGIGAVVASLFGALTSLTGWIAILGVALAVLAISALAGWVKLRKRDMGLLLEASGWAMNVHMKVTARVAPLFAFTPDLPKSAEIDKRDVLPPVPGEGRVKRLLTLLLLTVLAAVAFYALRHRGIIRL
ncbi:MAG: hypothetical protein R3A48_15745 [Polyangiales bacterium]